MQWDDADPVALAADGVGLLALHQINGSADAVRRDALTEAARPWAMVTMRAEAAARDASKALSEAGIRHVVLKGAGLAAAWKQSLGHDLRTYIDADVLVAEGDRSAAEQVILARNGGILGPATAGEVSLVHRNGAAIDLHWLALNSVEMSSRYRLDTAQLLDRADRSGPLPLLHPVDALVHTCLHAVASDAARLSAAYDVACLVRAHRYNPAEVVAVARSHRALLAVAAMVDRAVVVTGWPEVARLAAALPRSPWRWMCRRAAPSAKPSRSAGHSGSAVYRTIRTGSPTSLAALVAAAPRNLRFQWRIRHAAAPRPAPRVALISLEPWDAVWRRNQHLAAELARQGLVDSLVFVEPPQLWRLASRPHSPLPNVTVVSPPLPVVRRAGGLRIAAWWLRRRWLHDIDLLWINDPVLGALCLDRRTPTVYDVTDDWRYSSKPPRLAARLIRAEDRLAGAARTIVCSPELARRWRKRYGIDAPVVQNAAARASYVGYESLPGLPGDPPHVGYVGTLHEDRLDADLCVALARSPGVGTVHLVGPNALSSASMSRLAAEASVVIHPPVRSDDVPRWLMSFHLLVCPHVVTDFTLSLDAIKAFEYLATDRPVVATPTSGFQSLAAPGLSVVTADQFVEAVEKCLCSPPRVDRTVATWADRAREFAASAGISDRSAEPAVV